MLHFENMCVIIGEILETEECPMRYDANFCVAVRGPLEQVRKLPELPQEWFASLESGDQTEDVKSDVKMLERSLEKLKKISEKDAGKDGLVIAKWEDFTNLGLMYLRFLSYINEHPACQDVEVAATARVNYSVTDTVGYHSFWGCGEEGFYPEFDEPCVFRLRIPMSVMSRSGEKLELDLLEIENAGDIPIGSWGPFEMSSSDAVTTFEDTFYLFLQHEKDGTWNALLGGCDLEYALGGSKELETKVSELDDGGVPALRLLDAGEFRGDFPECSEETVRKLLELLLPKKKALSVEMRNGKPCIWDEEGNEYFLGGLIDVDIDRIGTAVDWWFPDGCDWIPRSLYKNG